MADVFLKNFVKMSIKISESSLKTLLTKLFKAVSWSKWGGKIAFFDWTLFVTSSSNC